MYLVDEPTDIEVAVGDSARLAVTVGSDACADLALEAHLVSPWGTWDWIGPQTRGAVLPARGTVELELRRRSAAVDHAGSVVGAGPGRLRRKPGLLACGQRDGAMNVATVGGVPVPVDEVDTREARLRGGSLAAALPIAGTSEGRQLRRWLTQLIVTERVVAAEAAARDVTAQDAPTEAEVLPDVTARLEIGSIAAAALADPCARALFARVTAAVEVSDEDIAAYHDETRCGSPRRPRTATAGAPQRSPLRRWRRCVRSSPNTCGPPRGDGPSECGSTSVAPKWCGWHPAMNTPATRVNPTTPTGRTQMLTLALDIGGTKIAVGLVDHVGELVHTARLSYAEWPR